MKQQAEELKKQGNEAMKDKKYTEAVFHYTHAIKIDAKNHVLYSNRSAAFLKIEQFYLALEDANKTIQLEPNWPKGYFRKGEVEFQAKHFPEALKSYNHAYVLDCTDEGIGAAITKTTKELNRLKKVTRQEPYLYSGVGCAIGVLIVLADQYVADKPSISHWIFQLLLIAVLGALGFLVCKLYRYMLNVQHSSLLEPPPDLLAGLDGSSLDNLAENVESEIPKKTSHGQKGGRQRYKKGKS